MITKEPKTEVLRIKPLKGEVIRARCSDDLKRAVERIALIQQLDTADIVRIAVATYVQNFRQAHFINA